MNDLKLIKNTSVAVKLQSVQFRKSSSIKKKKVLIFIGCRKCQQQTLTVKLFFKLTKKRGLKKN